MTEKPVERRNFLKYAATAIVCGVVAGVGGYFGGSAAVPPAVEKTVTKTVGAGETVTKTVAETATKTVAGPAVEKTVTETRTTTVPLVTKPIKIGIMNDFTGAFAAWGTEEIKGERMALAEINAHGGILGRKVETVAADAQHLAPESVNTAMERLLTMEKVDAVFCVGAPGSLVPGNGYDVVAKYATAPYIHWDTNWECQKLIKENMDKYWMIFEGDPPGGGPIYGYGLDMALSDLLETGKWTPLHDPVRVVLCRGEGSYANAISTFIEEAALKRGWEIVHDETVAFGTVEYSALLAKLRALEPDIITFTSPDTMGMGALTNQFAANPIKSLLYLQWGVSDPAYLNLCQATANGVIYGATPYIVRDEFYDTWRAEYLEKYAEGIDPGGGCSPGGYDFMYLYKSIAEQAGATEVADWVTAAENMKPFRGLFGGYYWGGPKKYDHMIYVYPNFVEHYWHESTDDLSLGNPYCLSQVKGVTGAVDPGNTYPYILPFWPKMLGLTEFEMPPWFK